MGNIRELSLDRHEDQRTSEKAEPARRCRTGGTPVDASVPLIDGDVPAVDGM